MTITGAAWLAMLAVFSGLAMNVILQFGIGLKGIAFDKSIDKEELLAGSGIIFVTIMFLWLFFSFIRSVMFVGYLEYVFLFPLCSLVFSVFEYLVKRFIFTKKIISGGVSVGAALSGASLFLTLNVASGFSDAAVLSLGFTLGAVLAIVIVTEIRRRSEMETVPQWLRGGPLALIAMGLLSLVFSSGAIMFFEVLGAH